MHLCCRPSKTSKLLPVADLYSIRTSGKHNSTVIPNFYNKIMEIGKVVETATIKFNVLEDKVK